MKHAARCSIPVHNAHVCRIRFTLAETAVDRGFLDAHVARLELQAQWNRCP